LGQNQSLEQRGTKDGLLDKARKKEKAVILKEQNLFYLVYKHIKKINYGI